MVSNTFHNFSCGHVSVYPFGLAFSITCLQANWLKREWWDPNGNKLTEWELDVPLAIKRGDVLAIKSTSATRLHRV